MTSRWLSIDLETRSTVDLRKTGAYVYFMHTDTGVWCASYAFDGEPVRRWYAGDPCPADIAEHVAAGGRIRGWNVTFERLCWQHLLGPRHGWPAPALEQFWDTAAQAAAQSLPRSLEDAARVVGLPVQKDKEGAALMLRMARPRRFEADGRPVWWDEPAKIERLALYCDRDVEVERELARRLRPLSDHERQVYLLDQRINDRGIRVDLELVNAAREVVDAALADLDRRLRDVTRGVVGKATRRNDLLVFLDLQGVEVDAVDKAAVRDLLARDDLPEAVRAAMQIRKEAAKASTAKLKAMQAATCPDGRARGLLLYHGAGTGRWAGKLIQPQNLPRDGAQLDAIPVITDRTRSAAERAALVDMIHGPPRGVVSSLLRPCLTAAPGHRLIPVDYSNIEGRGTAWLAGEQWKLEAFRAFDAGHGPDLYKLAYARSFGIAPEAVAKDQRQIGKVMELACFAADVPVVTNNGVKAITAVLPTDLLWDGVEWVPHAGLVPRGVRLTVNVGGISVTPDHLFLVGNRWTRALVLASSESVLSQALATSSANFPWSDTSTDPRAGSLVLLFNAFVGARLTRWLCTTFFAAGLRAAIRALKRRPAVGSRTSGGSRTSWRTTPFDGHSSTASRLASTDATTPTTAGSETTGHEASTCSSLGGPTAGRFSRMSRRCLGTIARAWSWTASTSTAATNRATCASSPAPRTAGTNAASATSKPAFENWKPVYDIAHAGPRSRFTILTDRGPLIAHNCGYQGGVGAFQTFAKLYGITVADEEADRLKTAWRAAHPRTVQLWRDMEDAALWAVRRPGEVVDVAGGKVAFRVRGGFLWMVLPGGRPLAYAQPAIERKLMPWLDRNDNPVWRDAVTYWGVDSRTRQWAKQDAYGGLWVENAVQAIARDIMADAMLRLDAAGYPLVLTVHDEVVPEVEDGVGSVDEVKEIMCRLPDWAAGFPIAAAGEETIRYAK